MQDPIRSLESAYALVPSRNPSRPRRKGQRRFSMASSAATNNDDDTPPPPERNEDLPVSPPLEDELGGRIDITA